MVARPGRQADHASGRRRLPMLDGRHPGSVDESSHRGGGDRRGQEHARGAERRVGDALHEARVVEGHGGFDAACVDAAPQLPFHLRLVDRRTGRGGHRWTVGVDAGLTEQRVRREPADVERRPGRRGQHPAGLHHHGVAHCGQGYPARGRRSCSLRMAANVAATGARTGAR